MKTRLITVALLVIMILSACRPRTPDSKPPQETVAAPTASKERVTPTKTASDTEVVATKPEYVPRFEETACPFDLPSGQIEGQTVECGYLVVPEDRSDPGSRDIRLAVAIFRHPDEASQPDPIIYLSGGPGGSALELLYLFFDDAFAPNFAAGRDLILFDQRGVGLSKPSLDCPGVQDLSIDLLDNQVGGRQLTDREINDLLLASLLDCEENLKEIADLSLYNTVANAADVNDLRLALRYDEVNLWGSSYGTRLALGVMRDFPEGLRSVVLDSAYPPDVDLYRDAPAYVERSFNVLFEACASDPVCHTSYPDLSTVFFNTVERLDAKPSNVVISNPITGESYDAVIDGDTFMALIFQMLYITELLPNLPMYIYQASQGDFEMIASIYGAIVAEMPNMSRGMMFSVQCHEEMPFSSLEAIESALIDYPQFSPIFEHSTLGGLAFRVCEQWDSGQADYLENEPVTSEIPALVMAGEYDPITPPSWGFQVTETLENSYYFEFPGMGHGVSKVAGCPREMVLDFLEDPTNSPEDACIADMEFTFIIPTDLGGLTFMPAQVPEYGIHAIVPEDWIQVDPDYYISPDHTIELVFTKSQNPGIPLSFGISDPFREILVNDLYWSLDDFILEDPRIAGYIASSSAPDGFYMVLVIGPPEKQAELYETLFLPVVEAFTVEAQ